jgi:hypothetical protein
MVIRSSEHSTPQHTEQQQQCQTAQLLDETCYDSVNFRYIVQ